MSNKPKLIAKKWRGDDAASWAIFVKGKPLPLVTGLTKREISYHKKKIAALLARQDKFLLDWNDVVFTRRGR